MADNTQIEWTDLSVDDGRQELAIDDSLTGRGRRATWRIWSGEHGAWWRPNSAGYTDDEARAGRYTRAEVAGILAGVGPEKRLKAKRPMRTWHLVTDGVDLGQLSDGHDVRARTAAGARYALFRQWYECWATSDSKRDAFLRFSKHIVRVQLAPTPRPGGYVIPF